MCPLPLDFVRSWPNVGQGRGIMKHKVRSIAQPAAFILHACWSGSLAFKFGSQTRPLQAYPMLEKLFGFCAGIVWLNLPKENATNEAMNVRSGEERSRGGSEEGRHRKKICGLNGRFQYKVVERTSR